MKLQPLIKFRNQNDGLDLHYSDSTSQNFTVLNDKGDLVPELTRTQQSFVEDCDINVQLERFTRTGVIPNGNPNPPKYGDFIGAPEFQDALNIVINAEYQFSLLDAKTRKRFGNDPAEYLEFVNNPENMEDAIKLGLFIKREETPSVDPKGISEEGVTPPARFSCSQSLKIQIYRIVRCVRSFGNSYFRAKQHSYST